ncbi:MAG: RcnB family protein [Azoarcus sp.]|jgi:Ni/Co efflux regulator RcnB|nr:RcnB family protein [Azoarcus sp.]
MEHRMSSRALLGILLAVGTFASASALAAPPDHDKKDRNHRSQPHRAEPARVQAKPQPRRVEAPKRRAEPARREAARRHPAPPPRAAHFEDRHRGNAHAYFLREYGKRHCPPGLTRRGSRCVSGPRAWSRGRALPRTVVYYDVPAPLLHELPPPPHGHRYVRVAGDILLITLGTGMVIDAIQDIFD